MRVIAYFLGGEAKEVHAEQLGMGEFDFVADQKTLSEQRSWTHVVHALIRRFLSDNVLREAQDAVERAEQKAGEDESEFADRVSKDSRRIRHVFTKSELINSFVQGVRPAVRKRVGQQVRTMTKKDRISLSAVWQVACAVGRSQRALIEDGRVLIMVPAEAKERPKRASRLVMIINEQDNQPMDRYADALDRSVEPDGTSAVDVTMDLGKILFAGQANLNEGQNPTGGYTPAVECVQKPIGYEKILADFLGGEESRAVT